MTTSRERARPLDSYCKQNGYDDIFRPDGDADGKACESLPQERVLAWHRPGGRPRWRRFSAGQPRRLAEN